MSALCLKFLQEYIDYSKIMRLYASLTFEISRTKARSNFDKMRCTCIKQPLVKGIQISIFVHIKEGHRELLKSSFPGRLVKLIYGHNPLQGELLNSMATIIWMFYFLN